MIKDFLLIYYENKDLTYLENLRNSLYPKEQYHEIYSNLQRPFLLLSLNRIVELYPESKIHILTNQRISISKKARIYQHVVEDLPRNHLAKFMIYNLLDEPCMYLDTDIILNRRFNEEDLQCEGKFNMFRSYHLKRLADYLGIDDFIAYNAGIVWIKEPSAKLVSEFETIHRNIFCDMPKLARHGLNQNVDEFSISYYCRKNCIKMNLSEAIGKPRGQIQSKDELIKYQSLHYMHLQFKMKMIEEYFALYPIKHL